MRLKAEQLASRLQAKGLEPIYLLNGDEPLQLIECADSIRRKTQAEGFEERISYNAGTDFDWNSLQADSANVSLFSSKRLLQLQLVDGKPGRDGSAVLTAYAANPPADTVLLITSPRLDKQAQKSKWYTALDAAGITISIWPIDAAQLPGWIMQRLQQQGKRISQPAAAFIAEQVEGNLLAARQEIDKLCLLLDSNTIELDDVATLVTDATRFNAFHLIESAMTGDTTRTLRMLSGLQNEGVDAAAVYAALMWEFRRLCNMAFETANGRPLDSLFQQYRVWEDKRKRAIRKALQQHPLRELHRLLQQAVVIDRQLKSQDRELAWDSLQSLLLAMAGKPILA